MKLRYTRDDMEVSPTFKRDEQYAALKASGDIVTKQIMRDGVVQPVEFFRKGAIVESPDAHRAVQMGIGEPADMACAARCGLTPEQMEERQRHYQRLVSVHVEDFDLYDAGVITGYDANGDYIPGPNWEKLRELRPVDGVLSDEDDDE